MKKTMKKKLIQIEIGQINKYSYKNANANMNMKTNVNVNMEAA